MFCKNCGNQLNDDSKFCTACGEKVDSDVIVEKKVEEVNIEENVVNEPEVQVVTDKPKQSGPWHAFAIVGMVIGIVSIALCLIPLLNYYVLLIGEFGIVFSALGMKSQKNGSKARTGLVLSIIGLVLAIIFFIVYTVVLEVTYFEWLNSIYN